MVKMDEKLKIDLYFVKFQKIKIQRSLDKFD